MRVRVMNRGSEKMVEVIISDQGSVGEALRAAKIPDYEWDNVRVTDVSVCMGTMLRPDDIVVYG